MLRRLRWALAGLGAVIAFGTLGYTIVERWDPFDSLYMTVITIGTVGFREVHPLSRAGETLTMVLIIAGVAALGFSLGTVVDFMVEGHFTGYLEERRMLKRLSEMSGHHVVAGLGRVGTTVAEEYEQRGVPFVVIDHDDGSLAHAREAQWAFVKGDATEEETLEAAGIERATSLVAALDADSDNLFVTLTARGINPKLLIVARSSARSSEAKLRRAGADRVLTPTDIGGRRMAAMVLQPGITDYLDVVMRGQSVELKLEQIVLSEGDPFVGMRIGDAHVRSRTGVYVLAIQRPDGRVDSNPAGDAVMEAGDRLVVLGTEEQLQALAGWACTDPEVCYIPMRVPAPGAGSDASSEPAHEGDES
jgi:voltage-gated potassium channel